MGNRKILITDDDCDLSAIVKDMLCSYNYDVDIAEDTEKAYDLLAENKYDLILLDVNMPGQNGLDFCREFRKLSSVPIIFLSARDSENDKITGLDNGGDDYIGKPFSLKELLSRINSLMRRTYGAGADEKTLNVGELEINPTTRTVTKSGKEVKLSLKEFDVLLYLAKNKNNAVKKETLLNEVWGAFSDCEASTLSVHIRWLREKLEEIPAEPKYIKTVWGIGYTLCDGEKI